jgi:hypothetical protein
MQAMEKIPKPNFFIVGAPKSGTTALYSYLSQHPEIFMSRLKEPQFFASDIFGHQRNVTTLPEYLRQFDEARAPWIGEASTCYLASPGATQEIKEFCPEARIIIMLRNPVDVMYAGHSERLVGGGEHIADFATALESNEIRRYRSGPFQGEPVVRLNYRDVVRFSRNVKRYMVTFGRPNVHVIVYDDFAHQPRSAYENALTFLGLSPNHECSFNVVNANRQVRSNRIHDLVAHPPQALQGLAHAILPRSIRKRLAKHVSNFNEKFAPRPGMDPLLRKRLQSECAQEVQELSRLIGRDLSNWTT